MNAGEVIDYAMGLLDETADEFVSSAELMRWLNAGLAEFYDKSEWVKGVFTISGGSQYGVAEYDFPDGLLRPEYIRYDGTKLEPTDLYKLDAIDAEWDSASPGTPAYYWFPEQRVLSLFPAPDAGGKVIKIYGIARPAKITSRDDEFELEDTYHMGLVYYLVYMGYLKDKKLSSAEGMQKKFLEQAASAYRKRWPQGQRDRRYGFYPSNIQ